MKPKAELLRLIRPYRLLYVCYSAWAKVFLRSFCDNARIFIFIEHCSFPFLFDINTHMCLQMISGTTKMKFLMYSRSIIDSDIRKKIDGAAVATAGFYDAVAGQLYK